MLDWPGDTAPADWMIAMGQALKRSTYPVLFAVVGTKYGAGIGDGTEFNLPDCRDKTVMGTSATKLLASAGGAESHHHGPGAMLAPSHAHSMQGHTHGMVHSHTGGTGQGNNITFGAPAGGYAAASRSDHSHTIQSDNGTRGVTDGPNATNTGNNGDNPIQGNTADTTVLPPYLSLNKIIKVL
jgi:microcystin-dependent protein